MVTTNFELIPDPGYCTKVKLSEAIIGAIVFMGVFTIALFDALYLRRNAEKKMKHVMTALRMTIRQLEEELTLLKV